MRQKKVWRYYCDHCNKGGCGKGHLAKHELHCIKNPQRACRMCVEGEVAHVSMTELMQAYIDDGIDGLRKLTEGCPACILATIVQYRITPGTGYDSEESEPDFDYKAEAAAWWSSVNEAKREWGY